MKLLLYVLFRLDFDPVLAKFVAKALWHPDMDNNTRATGNIFVYQQTSQRQKTMTVRRVCTLYADKTSDLRLRSQLYYRSIQSTFLSSTRNSLLLVLCSSISRLASKYMYELLSCILCMT